MIPAAVAVALVCAAAWLLRRRRPRRGAYRLIHQLRPLARLRNAEELTR